MPPSQDRAVIAARAAAENRGRDVLVLDLREIVKWTDFLVIASGSSRRQIGAMGDAIEAELKKVGDAKLGGQVDDQGAWLAVDFGDVVIHLLSDEKRTFYELEHLWGDAPRIEWRPSEPAASGRADVADQASGPSHDAV